MSQAFLALKHFLIYALLWNQGKPGNTTPPGWTSVNNPLLFIVDNYYKQTNCKTMSTKMGPSYANLFVGFIEHQFLNQYNGPKPDLYRCYIDDCIRLRAVSLWPWQRCRQ